MQESRIEPAWRRPAPAARRVAKALYGWREPGWVFLAALVAAMPFILAAMFAPALLSLAPTVDVIAPIAGARAIADGAARLGDAASPFHALLLLAADGMADAPGRVHLLAKALAAVLVAYPLAYIASARLPAAMTVLLTMALAAYTAAPFSGPAEMSLAMFLVGALAFLGAPADESRGRAQVEGVLAGVILAALWLSSAPFALAGFLALSACPFLTGKTGLRRYTFALASFAALALAGEALAPGLNLARADAASTAFAHGFPLGGEGALGLGGVAVSAAVVIFCAAVFGGGDHARGWAAALALALVAFVAARIEGANAAPAFVFGAALAALSVASPFYDGVFRDHDRASIAVSAAAAALTMFWTAALALHGAGQFLLQHRTALEAPANIRAELALIQPGGPSIARWIEEGRFSTPEARELFALAPIDQSMMLLEAAAQARQLASHGMDVAILTGPDSACVIGGRRHCSASGVEAAIAAKVVLAPRLDLDPATTLAKGRSEALLYTEFRLAGQTPLWDVWVRRGATLPGGELSLQKIAAVER